MRKHGFDTAAFYRALDAHRIAKKLTWKAVAEAAHVSASTLTRMAQGRRPDVDGLAKLCAWSGLKPDHFIHGYNGASEPREPARLAKISTLLRADPNLTDEGAAMLDDLIKAAYERVRRKV